MDIAQAVVAVGAVLLVVGYLLRRFGLARAKARV